MWAPVERFIGLVTLSSGVSWTLTVKSLCIWDNLNLLPMSMYLVFLTFVVNLFAVSHDWIKFVFVWTENILKTLF